LTTGFEAILIPRWWLRQPEKPLEIRGLTSQPPVQPAARDRKQVSLSGAEVAAGIGDHPIFLRSKPRAFEAAASSAANGPCSILSAHGAAPLLETFVDDPSKHFVDMVLAIEDQVRAHDEQVINVE
jgi:hypothetical protein